MHETICSIILGIFGGLILKFSSTNQTILAYFFKLPYSENLSEIVDGFCSGQACYNTSINNLPPSAVFLNYLRILDNRTEDADKGSDQKIGLSNISAPLQEGVSLFIKYTYNSMVTGKSPKTSLQSKANFQSEIFMNFLLPPIIFSAGYNMKKKHFFRNFGTILSYAFIGTLISTLITGGIMFWASKQFADLHLFTLMDCLYFGGLISATDPVTVLAIFNHLSVDSTLYALVFGESVLNDAVAVVITETVEQNRYSYQSSPAWMMVGLAVANFMYIFIGAFAIGVLMGLITALIVKFVDFRSQPLLETSIFAVMSYASYLLAGCLGLTGIVAILFCGIVQSHYTYHNLSITSQVWTIEIFELFNFLAESFVFLYMGVAVIVSDIFEWNLNFTLFALLSVLLSRAFNIYPLSFLINLMARHKSSKVSWSVQHMLYLSGLRGAMAFSLANQNTNTKARRIILSTTTFIVMFTVFVFGGFTSQLLRLLKIKTNVDDELEGLLRAYDSSAFPLSRITSHHSISVHNNREDLRYSKAALMWTRFDKRLMKSIFTHAQPSPSDLFPDVWGVRHLGQLLTSRRQKHNYEELIGENKTLLSSGVEKNDDDDDDDNHGRSHNQPSTINHNLRSEFQETLAQNYVRSLTDKLQPV